MNANASGRDHDILYYSLHYNPTYHYSTLRNIYVTFDDKYQVRVYAVPNLCAVLYFTDHTRTI